MITIFKNKDDIPADMEYIELNDLFFNQNTVLMLDARSSEIIQKIDNATLISKFKISSSFGEIMLDVDKLSTGCKTVLNVLYYPNKVFCMKECGLNALEVLYALENGYVFSDYAMIPFEMKPVTVRVGGDTKVISDYKMLKEWWDDE